jgi:hypothetical protein
VALSPPSSTRVKVSRRSPAHPDARSRAGPACRGSAPAAPRQREEALLELRVVRHDHAAFERGAIGSGEPRVPERSDVGVAEPVRRCTPGQRPRGRTSPSSVVAAARRDRPAPRRTRGSRRPGPAEAGGLEVDEGERARAPPRAGEPSASILTSLGTAARQDPIERASARRRSALVLAVLADHVHQRGLPGRRARARADLGRSVTYSP